MRTNIDLDDELIERAMKATGEATKTGVVHRALRELLRVEALRKVRGARDLTSWAGDLDQMRERQPTLVREQKATYGTTRRHKRAR
jgi:Arc/MetJ family transcription regulator